VKIHTRDVLELDEDERFHCPIICDGRERAFEVRTVFIYAGPRNQISSVQFSGPLVLLKGGVSVVEWGCCRHFDDLSAIPSEIREVWEQSR
jgi:hypothetical protein